MNIDPNTLNALVNIVLSVSANGLTSLIAASGHKLNELVVGKEFLEQQELEKTALHPILHQVIEEVAERVPQEMQGVEVICLFLNTPEVEEVVRQIYATKVTAGSSMPSDLNSVRKVFLILLNQYIVGYPSEFTPQAGQVTSLGTLLFDALIQSCNLLLDRAIDKGILSAHEAKEAFRYNIIYSEIKSIKKELNLLSTSYKMDRKIILNFATQYRQQVYQRHSRIVPPNLEAAHPYPIDYLYTYPTFMEASSNKKEQKRWLTKDEFFHCAFRVVVLGNPGAGKSTLTLKLCHDLVGNYSERYFANRRDLTPILVILQEYGADKKEHRCSIEEFIEVQVRSKYQLPAPPHHAFEHLLLTGHAMVIFDGLDELLDTSSRQEIRDDIEAFCHLYPSVPVLVTSREVGYEMAPLDQSMFKIFRIQDFGYAQVAEYVQRWFAIADAETLTLEQQQTRTSQFLKESLIVHELRSNPLMLALLCSIYREENYIPKNRPEVYEKCALMLLERWDKKRSLYHPPLPEEHISPLMEYLADWIYKDIHLRTGVTEEELIDKVTEYLHEWIYGDTRKAKKIGHEFVTFCTGRAWVFTDTGTKREGEKLYQFTHATFLEYFAAAYLVSICRTPEELLKVLIPKIAKEEWDVLAQLAFQLQSKKNRGVADELLTALVTQFCQDQLSPRWALLLFATRCLQFIVPRPKVRQYIVEVCVNQYITRMSKYLENKELSDQNEELFLLFDIIATMFGSAHENITTIFDTFKEFLVNEINNSNREYRSIIALELVFSLPNVVEIYDGENKKISRDIIKYVSDNCDKQVQVLCSKSLYIGCEAVWHNIISISDFIRIFGVDALTLHPNPNTPGLREQCLQVGVLLAEKGYESILTELWVFLESPSNTSSWIHNTQLEVLEGLGKALLAYPLPWIKTEEDIPYNSRFIRQYFLCETKGLSRDAIFGLFILTALRFESVRWEDAKSAALHGSGDFALEIEPEPNGHEQKQAPSHFIVALCARWRPELLREVQVQLDANHLTAEQQHFIWRWIRKEINLVGQPASE